MATKSVQSVLRAVQVLEVFQDRPHLTAAECAVALGVSRATAHRLLVTLHEAGLLDQTAAGHYQLGLRLFEIGAVAPMRRRLCDQSRLPMQRLASATGMTVNLAVRDGLYAVFLETIPGNRSQVPTRVGYRAPLHATSVGKVLLAHAPSEVVDEVVDAGLHPFTPSTIREPDELRRVIEQVRLRGAAFEHQEINPGVACIAAPVRTASDDVVAAVSVACPAALMTRRQCAHYLDQVRACVREIEKGLGWQSSLNWSLLRLDEDDVSFA